MKLAARLAALSLLVVTLLATAFAQFPEQQKPPTGPWMNTSLSPDQRADLVIKEMTLEEKITLMHGTGLRGLGPLTARAVDANGGAGYTPGIPRLGIPGIQMSDAAYGVRSSGQNGR